MRRYREHRHHHHTQSRRNSFSTTLRKPGTQVAILFVAALIVFVILQMNSWKAALSSDLPSTISVSDAYTLYQKGAFVVDVRTQEEWSEFHVPNTILIPLDQLPARFHEVPFDRPIIVVCRSGNRSQQGRDILLKAGFEQVTSMNGGLNEWRAKGYPIEP
jgi:rhodanese-related sulfurtransferase